MGLQKIANSQFLLLKSARDYQVLFYRGVWSALYVNCRAGISFIMFCLHTGRGCLVS